MSTSTATPRRACSSTCGMPGRATLSSSTSLTDHARLRRRRGPAESAVGRRRVPRADDERTAHPADVDVLSADRRHGSSSSLTPHRDVEDGPVRPGRLGGADRGLRVVLAGGAVAIVLLLVLGIGLAAFRYLPALDEARALRAGPRVDGRTGTGGRTRDRRSNDRRARRAARHGEESPRSTCEGSSQAIPSSPSLARCRLRRRTCAARTRCSLPARASSTRSAMAW